MDDKNFGSIEKILTIIMFFYLAIAAISIAIVSSDGLSGIVTIPLSIIASAYFLILFISRLYKNTAAVRDYYIKTTILVTVSILILFLSATTITFSSGDGVISFSNLIEFKETERNALFLALIGIVILLVSFFNYIFRVK